jgi:cell division protein FtsZ
MENFEIEVLEKTCPATGARIKAIGVGGGGGNMINHMINEGITEIDLIVANTDAQALASSQATHKIQLGLNSTRGLGAGMVPAVGRDAALESFHEIKEMLEGSDIVFISAGLGGGTGTGAAPIIAQAAKDVGALTVSIVTSPFKFEGRKREKLAKAGLEELKQVSDSIIVVPNEKLLSIVEKDFSIKESFKIVDDILAQAVGGISQVILSHEANNINLDFADVKTVMSHRGLALMGTGYATGTSAAYDATKSAIESPLLDNVSIDGAMGVLVHFNVSENYPLTGISEAMEIIYDCAHEDADVIFGTTTSPDLSDDEVRITIVATGFENHQKELTSQAVAQTAPKQDSLLSPNLQQINTTPLTKKVGEEKYNNKTDLDIPSFIRAQMD